MATLTITVEVTDTEQAVMLNDLTSINDWVQGAVTGKKNNCWKRMQTEWTTKLMNDDSFTDSIPSNQADFVALVTAREDYVTRTERDAAAGEQYMSTSRTREKADGELFKSTGIDDNATSTKVTVSNTGIDVTGRATTDGITSSGTIIFDNGNSSVGIHSDSSDGSYIAYGANEYLRFLYDAGGGETMRMHDSGYVTMPQGVTLGNGNTYAASNTLDDYEEGTFTPGGTGIDTSNSVGIYTKIGNVCHTQMWILANGSTGGTLTGLPFTLGTGSTNYICVGTIGYINGNVTGVVGNGATTTLTMYNGVGTGTMSSGQQMHLGLTYITT